MGSLRYALVRVAQYALVLFVALVLNFAIPRMAPGDPLYGLVGENAALLPVETQRAIIQRAGLDQPLHAQFARYLDRLAHGDLGFSYNKGRPVAAAIKERLPLTLLLLTPAALVSAVVGVLLGVRAAWRRGSRTDVGFLALVLGLDAMPVFFLGTLLLLALAVELPFFPVSSALPIGFEELGPGAQAGELARRLTLPFVALTLSGLGPYFLVTRSSMLGTLGEDYVLMARAKGCPIRRVVQFHALRNALLPVFTLFSLNLGVLLGGAVLVETVFSYPGLGRLAYDAVVARDFPMLQGTFLVATVGVVGANLIADLGYPLLDPRVRSGAHVEA